MMDKIEDMMELLRTMGASVVGTTDEFYGEANDNNGIWISAESTPSLFNYYSEAWGNTFGVNPELNDVVLSVCISIDGRSCRWSHARCRPSYRARVYLVCSITNQSLNTLYPPDSIYLYPQITHFDKTSYALRKGFNKRFGYRRIYTYIHVLIRNK